MRLFTALLLCVVVFSASFTLEARPSAKTNKASSDVLEPVMLGEFALQVGKLPEAAYWYLQAAQASKDAGLAELATRIALLANDDKRATQALNLWQQRAPKSVPMRAAQASLAIRKGQKKSAKRMLKSLLRDEDQDGWRYALAALEGGGRNPGLSSQLLTELLNENALPDEMPIWLAFGGFAQTLPEQALAERIVNEVIARFPVDPRVALLHVGQLLQADKQDEARKILDTLQSKPQLDPDIRLGVAAEYDSMGLSVLAAETLAKGPQDTHSYGLRASLLAKAEDNAGLEALYAEAQGPLVDVEAPQQRLLLGQIAESIDRLPDALAWYKGVYVNKSADAEYATEARLYSINVLDQLGRNKEALAQVRAMQTDARIDESARRGAYLVEAELYQRHADSTGEINALSRGLAAYPDSTELLYARSLVWERRDQIDRAEADLRKVLVILPTNTNALNALGYMLADRTTRYTEALELIERARTAEPNNPAIIDSYAWVLYRLGRNDEALVQMRRAYALMKDPELAAHLAQLLWEMGQRDEANQLFEEARKMDPENRSLKRALENVGK